MHYTVLELAEVAHAVRPDQFTVSLHRSVLPVTLISFTVQGELPVAADCVCLPVTFVDCAVSILHSTEAVLQTLSKLAVIFEVVGLDAPLPVLLTCAMLQPA